MTVGELKALLANLNDDLNVVITDENQQVHPFEESEMGVFVIGPLCDEMGKVVSDVTGPPVLIIGRINCYTDGTD